MLVIIGSVLGFVLTVIGTVYGILSYHKPRAALDATAAVTNRRQLIIAGLTTSKVPFSRRQRLGQSLQAIICKHVYHAGQRVDYGTHQVKLAFYVDLMESAVIPEELNVMSAALACFLRDAIQYPYDIIAVPKNGNPLLGCAVARKLKKKLLIVKDHSPHRTYKLDGTFDKTDTAVLVDDVSSDGEFLAKSLGILRHYHIRVDDCATIVHRVEGPAAPRLRESDCNFHAMLSLSDQQIERILGIKALRV